MATLAGSLSDVSHLGGTSGVQADSSADPVPDAKQRHSCFVRFDDKEATVFVNACHIVRFEYHPTTGRAHLQLSDGHHYYLSEENAMRVIRQLEESQ